MELKIPKKKKKKKSAKISRFLAHDEVDTKEDGYRE